MDQRLAVRVATMASLAAGALALSGCMSSPTYGTDKTASEQLLGDVSNAFSLKPQAQAQIDYKPRPELVKPAPGQKEALPAPQDSITQTASNEWPESPEQRRARLRDEATAHQNDPNYQPQIVDDNPGVVAADQQANSNLPKGAPQLGHDRSPAWTTADTATGTAARRTQIAKQLQEQKQGDPTTRKYLSEPPLAYRVAADTAPQNDIGEDEYKKARRLKREAATKSGKSGWFDWLPSL